MRSARIIPSLVVAFWCCQSLWAAPLELLPEELVVSDSRNYQMSRNPNHSMTVARDGTVHLVFWDDAYLDTSPAHPSTVWYCRRDPSGRWRSPEIVDDSYTSGTIRVGGRHPSIVLRSNGEIRVFWHDYRNCSAAKKWINNTEIYMDTRPSGGLFSPNDVRLTSTTATHDGDNGYAPRAILSPTGEILAAWHDYHFNRNAADIFLARSDTQGRFNPTLPIDSFRLTNVSQRAGGDSYTLPDLALDASNTVHLVWTRDNLAGYGVYYARLKSGSSLSAPVVLSSTGGDFLDAPHITASPRGDIFVLWTEYGTANGDSDIVVARLRRGASLFDPPFTVTGNLSNQFHGDLKVDALGLLHVVWADERNGRDEIFYGAFDPESKVLLSEMKISQGDGDAVRPAIALDQRSSAYVAWMDDRNGQGSIYFRAIMQPTQARVTWTLYR